MALVCVLLLLFSLLVLRVADWLKVGLGDVAKTFIIAAPLAVYLLSSQLVDEVDFGGLKAKMHTLSSSSVAQITNETKETAAYQLDVDPKQLSNLSEGTLRTCHETITIHQDQFSDIYADRGSTNPLNRQEDQTKLLARIIYHSLLCGAFVGLVVLDEDNKPMGFMAAVYFSDLLDIQFYNPQGGNRTLIADTIRSNSIGRLLNSFASEKFSSAYHTGPILQYTSTISAAYKAMQATSSNFALLVSPSGHYEGFISRKSIETWTIANLLEPYESHKSAIGLLTPFE